MADKPHPDRPMSMSAARRKAREAALEEWDEFSKVLGLATSLRIVKPHTPGPPIGRFEGVEEALARIAGKSYTISALSRMTCTAVDLGEKPAVASGIAKCHATEMSRERAVATSPMRTT